MTMMAFPQEQNTLSLWNWFHSPLATGIPEVLLMDGGVSTHLEALIAPKTFSHRSLWSSSLLLTEEGKDSIIEGHRVWLESGSDILTTVTYQCHHGLFECSACTGTASITEDTDSKTEVLLPEEKRREMMIDGVLLAKQAIDESAAATSKTRSSSLRPGPFVVASTGPYGAAMADGSEYTGKYPAHVTREKLVEFHTRKAQTLLLGRGKPDGLAVETIPNLEEVGVVCEVLRDLQQKHEELQTNSSPVACWVSLACRNGSQINDGHTMEEALRILQSYDPTGKWIAGVGINCFDSSYLTALVTTLIRESRLEHGGRRGIIIYPNSGEGWDAANEEWKDGSGTTEDELADRLIAAVQLIRDACAMESHTDEGKLLKTNCLPRIIVGGCCRTHPATIAKLRKWMDKCDKP